MRRSTVGAPAVRPADVTSALLRSAQPGAFSPADVEDLPEPVARDLASALEPGTPTAGARIRAAEGVR